MLLQLYSNVIWFCFGNLDQDIFQVKKGCILKLIEPTFDMDPIRLLLTKVLSNVVYNQCVPQISSNFRKVFYSDVLVEFMFLSMASIQSMTDAFLNINLIQNPISVALLGCSEDDKFIVLLEISKEVVEARTRVET
jgi:hypothetical protein